MSGINLSHEVGPLPVGAWLAVVGGGLGIAYWRRKNGSAASVTPGTDTSVPSGVGTGAVGGYVDNSTPSPSAPDQTTIADNATWARQATNYLIAQNYDPAVSDSAIRKYLSGASLSVTEYALIKVALMKFGAPPEGIPVLPPDPPATPTAPAPPTAVPGPVRPPVAPPAPQPTGGHPPYRVVPGDSLWKISAKVYGSGAQWPRIYNANRGLIGANPNLIHPGQVLVIP